MNEWEKEFDKFWASNANVHGHHTSQRWFVAPKVVKEFISQAIQKAREEERKVIREKWKALQIQAGAACGPVIGLIANNPMGEKDGMQVRRNEFKDFIDSLK